MEQKRKTKLLITGASGLLGSNASLFFSDQFSDQWDVHGVYHHHPIGFPKMASAAVDLTDEAQLMDFLERMRPDIILHTAGMVNVDLCESQREFARQINVSVPEHLARWAANHQALLVHVSSDAFFDKKDHFFEETEIPQPLNYYGVTKAEAEDAIRKSGCRHLIVRTNFYGWNFQSKLSLSEWMLNQFSLGKKTPLFFNVFYTPIHTWHLLRCLKKLLDLDVTGTIHIASQHALSKLDFGRLLANVFQLDSSGIVPTSVEDSHLIAPRSCHMALSTKKLRSLLPDERLDVDADLQEFKRLREAGFIEQLRGATPIV